MRNVVFLIWEIKNLFASNVAEDFLFRRKREKNRVKGLLKFAS